MDSPINNSHKVKTAFESPKATTVPVKIEVVSAQTTNLIEPKQETKVDAGIEIKKVNEVSKPQEQPSAIKQDESQQIDFSIRRIEPKVRTKSEDEFVGDLGDETLKEPPTKEKDEFVFLD